MELARVLIVDDEAQVTTLLRKLLERTGRYEVRTENRGSLAHSVARAFRPHVILMDVCMPDADGPEVAAAIEKDPELAGIPLMFLTGLASPDEIGPSGLDAGAHVYLPKPIRLADLLRRLDFAVGAAA